MRNKIIAGLAIALLLASMAGASASLIPLTSPVIRPASDGDNGKLMGAIEGLVAFTNDEIASKGNASADYDRSIFSNPITTMPGATDLLAALAPPGKSSQAARDNINTTLIGKNLTYTSIAGKPLNYTITADSIKSVQPFAYKGERAWKVRVGEGLAWDLIMDTAGTKILKTDQLFQT